MAARPIILAVLAAALFAGEPANAAPLFSVELDFGGVEERGPEPITLNQETRSNIDEGNFDFESAFGAAGRGILRTSARATIFWPDIRGFPLCSGIPGGHCNRYSNEAIAFFRLDDVIITGPGGASEVSASLNLRLDGSTSANTFFTNPSTSFTSSAASANVDVSVAVGPSFRTRFDGSAQTFSSDLRGSRSESTGILTGFSGLLDLDLTTAAFMLPVDTFFPLFVSLGGSARIEVDVRGADPGLPVQRIAEAQSSFANSLSFPFSGPVFVLPTGFTANSESGLIRDNMWIGAPTSVPEPSALLLVALGLAALVAARRSLP
ncbi:MAG TPA: PEP-CTERM sorting domain-containing protein [Longimicrobiales bacterium]|nr:PEP-CTERM sorting domain-containing protein [Longimicrobiales bacterium]